MTGVADYHINSDEPSVLDYNTDFKSAGQLVSLYAPDQFRISDHDPVVIGLTPNAPGSVSINNIPGSAIYGGSFTVTYAGSYDGTTSVTSSTPTKCEVSGDVVSFVGVGICSLTAHVTEGTNYFAADGTPQDFSIEKATLTVTPNPSTSTAKIVMQIHQLSAPTIAAGLAPMDPMT